MRRLGGNRQAGALSTRPVSYARTTSMSGLIACPFCRQMFETSEARSCPDCGLGLEALTKLPPSYDAKTEYPEEPTPPHMEPLPWTYARRNRGLLVGLSLMGLAAFFAPWIRESAPELRDLTGYRLAQLSGYFWAPAVAYFVMIPLVVTRRSIYKMRGSRVAVAFLAGIVLTTAAVRLGFTPKSTSLRPVHVEWMWGLYATAGIAVATVAAALGFGGRLDDIPTRAARRGNETLH